MPAGLALNNSQGAETQNILSTNLVFNKQDALLSILATIRVQSAQPILADTLFCPP